MFCIQETKCSSFSVFDLKAMGVYDNSMMISEPSTGQSGGLLTFWDPSVFSLHSSNQARYWIHFKFTMINSDDFINVINVYAPQEKEEKRELWRELEHIILSAGEERVCFVGDFNCVRKDGERRNCLYRDNDSKYFNEFIEFNELREPVTIGSVFTWCGVGNKLSRLDRALLSWSWVDEGDWLLETLDRKSSYHRAICLRDRRID